MSDGIRYFEDFSVGERFESEARRLEEEDILAFARDFDPQFFHADPERAAASHFGGLIASGLHTLSVSMGQFFRLRLLEDANLSSPGIDELRWLRPVRPGDAIRQKVEVLECRPSRSKPDRGLIVMRHDTVNQRDEVVMTFTCMHLLLRRPQA